MQKNPQTAPAGQTRDIGPGTTISGRPRKTVYRPIDTAESIHDESISDPGQQSFTRGVHPEMHGRGLGAMQRSAGMGTARRRHGVLIGTIRQFGHDGGGSSGCASGPNADDRCSRGRFT